MTLNAARPALRRTDDNDARGTLLASLALIPLSLLIHGWMAKTAWNWFVPPVLGWPRLALWQAVGLSIAASVFRPRASNDSDRTKTPGQVVLYAVSVWVGGLLALGVGWIIHTAAF